jgi:hypothetical protein
VNAIDQICALIKEHEKVVVTEAKAELSERIVVGPYIHQPDEVRAPGFTIFIGQHRVGWWSTREEAFEIGKQLQEAVLKS